MMEVWREQYVRFNYGDWARNAEFMTLHLSFEGHSGIHSSFKQQNVSDPERSTHRCAEIEDKPALFENREPLPLFDGR